MTISLSPSLGNKTIRSLNALARRLAGSHGYYHAVYSGRCEPFDQANPNRGRTIEITILRGPSAAERRRGQVISQIVASGYGAIL